MIIFGKRIPTNPLVSTDFIDNPDVALRPSSYTKREGTIKGIVLHTRMGLVARRVQPNGPNHRWDEVVSRRWAKAGRSAGAHLIIDADGSYACTADLGEVAAYHAGQVNQHTIGIEIYQSANGDLYKPALETAAFLVEILCDELDIPKRFPYSQDILAAFARGGRKPWRKKRALGWMEGGESGSTWKGVYGHRNCTRNRGRGDPGDEIFRLLEKKGFSRVVVR